MDVHDNCETFRSNYFNQPRLQTPTQAPASQCSNLSSKLRPRRGKGPPARRVEVLGSWDFWAPQPGLPCYLLGQFYGRPENERGPRETWRPSWDVVESPGLDIFVSRRQRETNEAMSQASPTRQPTQDHYRRETFSHSGASIPFFPSGLVKSHRALRVRSSKKRVLCPSGSTRMPPRESPDQQLVRGYCRASWWPQLCPRSRFSPSNCSSRSNVGRLNEDVPYPVLSCRRMATCGRGCLYKEAGGNGYQPSNLSTIIESLGACLILMSWGCRRDEAGGRNSVRSRTICYHSVAQFRQPGNHSRSASGRGDRINVSIRNSSCA